MILADVSVRRPVTATMGIAALVVMGVFSYRSLVVDLFPRTDIPVVSITTTLPGAGPEEVEARVTKVIEESVNTVSGIDELYSTTLEGFSRVVVLFRYERNLEEAAQDVRDKIGAVVAQLPDGTDPPVVEKFDPDNTPVMFLSVAGSRDLRELTEIAEKRVKEPIESLPGVGDVRIIGGREREVQVLVNPRKLEAYGLTLRDVAQALASQNAEVPGGRVIQESNETIVRTLGRVEHVREFEDIVIATRNGAPIRIGDVARADDGVIEPRSLSRYNGRNGLTLQVRKQSGANTVATVDAVMKRLEQIRPGLPAGVEVNITRDQARFIRMSLAEVQKHLIVGALLASIVVFFFMGNWRATIISAVAIPCSVIATFTLMKALGFSINWLTLLALTLAVGIVIDDAIVVLENIFRFVEEKDMGPMEAARAATQEVGLAVSATTLSLVVVFAPVAFIPGVMGQFLSSFGLTMSCSILVSLLVAFTLTPMLCSRFLKHHGPKNASREAWFFRPIDLGYDWLLRGSMRHRLLVVLMAVATIASIPLLGKLVGTSFVPEDERGDFEINIKTPPGWSLSRTDAFVAEIEKQIQAMPGVLHLTANVGSPETEAVTEAKLAVVLKPRAEREVGQFALMAQAREMMRQHPEVRASVDEPPAMSGSGMRAAQIVYNVQGADLEVLEGIAREVRDIMTSTPGVVDVNVSSEPGKPEFQVSVNRAKAADLGVGVADVAMTLRTIFAGDVVTTYKDGTDLYDVRLRVDEPFRSDPEILEHMAVPSAKLGQTRLDSVVTVNRGTGPAQIDRRNRERQITLEANLAPGYALGDVLAEIDQRIARLQMPAGYHAVVTGMGEMMRETQQGFALAFLLSIIFMYMVLAAQFESFLHPITILLSLPLAVPFALFSLWLVGGTLNLFSALGVLLLFGVVKKNSILQIDHTIGLRAGGMPMSEAIITANRERLRPILMTTISLVAGMLPLVFSGGEGAETNRSIGVVVMGGQTLCLLITLLITPVAYSLFEDMKTGLRGKRVRVTEKEPRPKERHVPQPVTGLAGK